MTNYSSNEVLYLNTTFQSLIFDSAAVPKDSTPTIYDAFAEKERQERLKQTGKEQVKPKPEANGKKPQHKPKPKQQHDKPKGKKTLEQALQQVGLETGWASDLDCNKILYTDSCPEQTNYLSDSKT